MDRIRLAMACINSRVGEVERNAGTMISFMEKAAESEADLICFPEMCLTGYSMPRSFDYCLGEDSPAIERIVDASKDLGLCTVFGYADSEKGIAQAVTENGKLLGTYRKTHLGLKEKEFAKPGNGLPVFRTSKATIGIQLCLESHFPEISGTLALKGADIILMPHASGLEAGRRRMTWNKILPARAYDNTVFVAACNQAGDNGLGTVFGGGSCVMDINGDLLAEDYSGECLLMCDLDGKRQEELRTSGNRDMHSLYFLDRRRPELYQ